MNRRRGFSFYGAIAIFAALAAIAPTTLFSSSYSADAGTERYSQFISEVQNGQVEKVTINADRPGALVVTHNVGEVTVDLPQDLELLSVLDSSDVGISVSNQVDDFSESEFLVSILPLIIFVLLTGVGLVGLAFWLWILVDCAMYESSEGNNKLVWILIIVFAGWIGALVYFFVRRPQRISELGR